MTSSPSEAWEQGAQAWTALARGDGDGTYAWNAPAFFDLLPPPGHLTVDVGCGEGRVPRELLQRGHRVLGVDASPTLVRLAREAEPEGDYRVADAASLPVDTAAADLVVAFMSLQDVEDLDGAVRECARVLEPGGRLCFAILHPVTTAGDFVAEDGDAAFAFERSYFEPAAVERRLGASAILQFHRPLETYARVLEQHGFAIEALRELPTRRRAPGWIPMFLHVRAVKR